MPDSHSTERREGRGDTVADVYWDRAEQYRAALIEARRVLSRIRTPGAVAKRYGADAPHFRDVAERGMLAINDALGNDARAGEEKSDCPALRDGGPHLPRADGKASCARCGEPLEPEEE